MAGILDSKERIIDFIVTSEGMRQANAGQMKIEFASFTDYHTFYAQSGSASGDPIGAPGVAADASKRIFFEATNRYQDVIIPEVEVGNTIRPFKTADFDFTGHGIASGTAGSGFAEHVVILTGSALPNVAVRSMDSLANNFNDLRILGTEDEFADTSGFALSVQTGSFNITDHTVYGRTRTGTVFFARLP